LQSIRQASLLPHEILHEPERGSAERIVLADTIDYRRRRDTGAANLAATLEQRNLVTSTLQVIRGYQPVNAGANDGDFLRSFLHEGKS
jgi:hypothetical protein